MSPLCVLGIDTATGPGSTALARPGEVIARERLDERGWHARDLLTRVDRMLAGAGVATRDLTGIAVTVGPGSFTGVRIGMATAKGLAYSLNVGLGGLSTLEALARGVPWGGQERPRRLCVAIAAGRGEVYAALFRIEGGEPCREGPERSLPPADLVSDLPRGTVVAGGAAAAVAAAAREAGLEIREIESDPLLAGPVALWGCRTLRAGESYLPGALRPIYLRPSDAEAARR
ncbi:MAG TPA: tRNA (adenosine(37)-N6)-threonylcarbamoyltransferase complex dimerization subunit type 1 TsaB [Candidatus Dormibacteraeota bacterium]|nr:tRNA (adenosine(37)-N6)-threonylcarbamoyltransferase complex dimerization subunit type 1 TsaB [Candidatus Dormibacteraeota bacterium]